MHDTPLPSGKPRDPVEMTYAPARRTLRRRLGSAARYWARNTFSRESLVSSLKSLLWVAPLTALIWVYAEREQVSTQMIGCTIEAPAAEAGRVVTLIGLPNGTVHAELRGPQAGLDQVRDWIESSHIPLEVDHNLPPGEQEIDLTSELNKLPQMVHAGVTVDKCEPPKVQVNIDPIIDHEVEIRVRPDEVRRLVGPPVFTPSKVRVIGPQSILTAAVKNARQNGTQFVAYASLKPFAQVLSDPGKHDLSSVPLSVNLDNPHVMISPVTVSAHLDVKAADQRLTIDAIRVLAASPPGDNPQTEKYKVVFDASVTRVTVTGPEDQIARIRNHEFIPWAVFLPDYTNTQGTQTAQLTFELPPGVQVSPEDTNRKIEYSFKPRSATDQ